MIDEWFEAHLRGRPAVDRIMYTPAPSAITASSGWPWRRPRRPVAAPEWRRPLLRAAAGLGIESALVNGPVKWLFRRTRPVHDGPRPLHLRQPLTSSFPSGHATAAFFGAALLRDDDRLAPLYYAIAVIVAASRVHVKIHHASDVIGGIALGIGAGRAGPAPGPGGATRLIGASQPGPESPSRPGARLTNDMSASFAVTWDYRCPFARNAHEHLLTAVDGGADWDVRYLAFSLDQAHVEEGQPPVWEEPDRYPGSAGQPGRRSWCGTGSPSSSPPPTGPCFRPVTTRRSTSATATW